ncbi:MAG TPA: hypothetical protein VGP08_09530 [Pyrinomonadaceae bacterium]|jgi:hypothetical protein|nr:hypothetical protein [Pyrinomonadaceae bacterium]
MIRYSLPSRKKLEAEIKSHAPDWLKEAKKRTGDFKEAGKYFEPPKPNWTKIKAVYMKYQFNKCAYCEQKLSGGERGPVQHHVEHYRPKGNVGVWPTKKKLKKLGYKFQTGDPCGGYHLLPYNILNYVTACVVCNSTLKRDYFPVKGKRVTDSASPSELKKEGAYLLHPLGTVDDDDPEELIVFGGVAPAPPTPSPIFVQPRPNPALKDPDKIRRARVTIDFFELDIRESLIKQRAEVIKKMFEAVRDKVIHPDADRRARAVKDLDRWQEASSEHASCARSFHRLCESDLNAANDAYKAAVTYIDDHPEL